MVYDLRSNFMASMKPAFAQSVRNDYEYECGRMFKSSENWLNTAAFGHMEHYNIKNVAPTASYKMSERNIFLLQPFEHQQIRNPLKRQVIAGQRTVTLLLVLNDAHNLIHNPWQL